MRSARPDLPTTWALVGSFLAACSTQNTSGENDTSAGADVADESNGTTPSDVTASTAGDGGGDGDDTGDGDGDRQCIDDPALFDDWQDGTDCEGAPDIEVRRMDDNTYLLRQSLCTNFEAPFMYLLFGEDTVLLEDTGAGGVQVAEVVYDVIDAVLLERGQDSIELVVLNSHGHGDHTAGNSQFANQPGTTVVGIGADAVADYFGIVDWPTQSAQIELGGRSVELLPIPGHQDAHVALYDSATRWLLTGDTLYPGRLYIADFDTYLQSLQRLVTTFSGREVCAVMGTHIEMRDRPGQDFPFASTEHPSERDLLLEWDHLLELLEGVESMQGAPVIEVHDDFIIYPL